MKLSENINELAKALSLCQGEISNATKNSVNPHFGKKYADLAEVLDVIRPCSSKYGLSFSQCNAMKADGRVYVETILMHESGQYIIFDPSEAITKTDPQGIGGATTYLRRYSIAAVFGIAQEDDDGNSASKPEQPKKQETPAERARNYINANAQGEHRQAWLDMLEGCGSDNEVINLAKELASVLAQPV